MRFEHRAFAVAASLTILVTFNPARANTAAPVAASDLHAAALSAVSADSATAQGAIELLRKSGPAGLQTLCDVHQSLLVEHSALQRAPRNVNGMPTASAEESARWKRLKSALDAVAGQYDAYASRLYWYTDFDQAQAAARSAGKPILSLRLLGNLTDEYSCANSRFFRSTLYANAEVSRLLGERFVLHWKSVRPVPKVTIDFGDGRSLKRTLTGNSVHYVLDRQGRVVDALPGLYGAKAFLAGLDRAAEVAIRCAALDENARTVELRRYHAARSELVRQQWQDDLRQIGALPSDISPTTAPPVTSSVSAPSESTVNTAKAPRVAQVVQANAVAVTKSAAAEASILAAVLVDAKALESATTDETWDRIAQRHAADAELDAATRDFIVAQNPTLAERAAKLAMMKRYVESPFLKMFRTMQQTIAVDTVRNEYLLHRQIHDWFATEPGPISQVDALNVRVYDKLFLSPADDRWYGLVPDGAYAGLDDNGMCTRE